MKKLISIIMMIILMMIFMQGCVYGAIAMKDAYESWSSINAEFYRSDVQEIAKRYGVDGYDSLEFSGNSSIRKTYNAFLVINVKEMGIGKFSATFLEKDGMELPDTINSAYSDTIEGLREWVGTILRQMGCLITPEQLSELILSTEKIATVTWDGMFSAIPDGSMFKLEIDTNSVNYTYRDLLPQQTEQPEESTTTPITNPATDPNAYNPFQPQYQGGNDKLVRKSKCSIRSY